VVRPRSFALLLTAVTVAALLGTVALAVRWPDIDLVQVVSTVVLTLPSAVVGLVVGLRRPDNAVGPLMSLQAATFAVLIGWQGAYDQVVLQHPAALPASAAYAALERGSWMALYVPVALIMLTFPEGRFLGRRWYWVAGGLLAVTALFTMIAAMSPSPLPEPFSELQHPFGTAPLWLRACGWALLPVFMGLLVASAAAMVLRYRRSTDPVERAQVRWLALGAWSLPATLLLCWVSLLIIGRPDLAVIGLAFILVAIPATTAVAMLRHDLYDVDRALSAAATYSVLSACLLAVFTVTEVVVGLVLGRGSDVVAAVATAIAVAALAPSRRRAQRAVDRRLYPMRAGLHQSLADLRAGIDGGTAQPEAIEPTLRHALQAPHLRVGYIAPGRATPLDTHGDPVDGDVPVLLAGHRVGVLDPGRSPASRELLREAAVAGALFVELARLRLGMAEAMAEIRHSRSRMLRHGYQERRKLQRDLHDGAQQRLVALGMSLRLAQRHLRDSDFDIDGMVDHAVAQLGTAVAELRTIADGLRPPSLDAGLGAAIRSLAATVPMPVELDVCDDEVPDDIATTAYYVVSEGLANAIKHAHAGRLGVSLARHDGHLTVEIRDDGVGGACRTGSGLAGLGDRVAATGGVLRVESPTSGGTRMEAVLPCGS
jgi:signal transduction histidine kinase